MSNITSTKTISLTQKNPKPTLGWKSLLENQQTLTGKERLKQNLHKIAVPLVLITFTVTIFIVFS